MRMVWNRIALFFLLFISLNLKASTKQDSIQVSNRHVFIAQGDNANEMETGDYVVVATTLTEEDAKSAIKEFKKLKYPEPSYGYATAKSIWYINYGPYQNIEEAKKKRDEYRAFPLFKNAYLLTIHESRIEESRNMNRHDFVQRENNNNDLQTGDYAIVGVFNIRTDAHRVTEELKKLNFPMADFGYLTQRKLWYVHLGKYDSIDAAKTELEKHRQSKMFKDAWLLTVHQ